ncbi:hypothetical protein ACF0H5_003139 [Mactra antiquata]
MHYDTLLDILNKRYSGVFQKQNTQELSMNYQSHSAVFNITSAGGLTQSLTTAEQTLKEKANSEKTYFNTYFRKFRLTYETSAGVITKSVSIRDCILVFMMDNLVRLKKHADPNPGESRSMQICTLPMTIKRVPRDAVECELWHDPDCDSPSDVCCTCKEDIVLKRTDVDSLLMHASQEQSELFDQFQMLITLGHNTIWRAVVKGKILYYHTLIL